MKESPILFSGEMVRAILDGRKSMTRRVVKPQPGEYGMKPFSRILGVVTEWKLGPVGFPDNSGGPIITCPYGMPGDRLWVRETFFHVALYKHAPLFAAVEPDYIYRADYEYMEPSRKVIGCHHWKPSIFMPRAASRITLEITSIRVERLNQISRGRCDGGGVPFSEHGARAGSSDVVRGSLAEDQRPSFVGGKSLGLGGGIQTGAGLIESP